MAGWGGARRALASMMVGALSSCVAVLGEYRIDDDETPPSSTGSAGQCERDEDCNAANNEMCSFDYCFPRCLDDRMCPAHATCWAGEHCTAPVGTPCKEEHDSVCGGYPCFLVDINAMPVAPYCTGSCSDDVPCPTGFVCDVVRCYKQ